MTTVYVLEHDDEENYGGDERTGYAYVRGIYATEKAALDDLPNTLVADADGHHWSPGPHNAECCAVRPVLVMTAPTGKAFVQD
jgi:hypothetical protein